MDGPPPPPPPHGEKPNTTQGEYRKASDLPDGNYDIFVIPPHSSGSGFLYLPSLQCHRNSFIAGSLSTLFAVLLWFTLAPLLKTWYATTIASGSGVGVALLAIGVGVAGWAFGASQADNGSRGPGFSGFGSRPSPGPGAGDTGSQGHSSRTGPNHSRGGSNFGGSNTGQNYGGDFGGGNRQGGQYGHQRGSGGPPPNQDKGPETADWDRAREETKRKEDIRRKMEEFKRKREAEAREKEKQREREAMEREWKDRQMKAEKEIAEAKEAAAREARQKAEREVAEERERKEKEAAAAKEKREKDAAEAKARAEREAAEKEAEAKASAKKEADAKFAALKEAAAKRYAEKKAKDAQDAGKDSASDAPRTPSPKKPPFPTARTATDDDDAYSFRPYDRPRRPYAGASGSSMYSESSYAASQSTAPTTPPPSHRATYSTKDPDKIVIRGVYSFNNAFPKTPTAQLVSGQGMVTDGLVLRITSEGLFIDDDVRGVPQREWDVKAWTMKLAEVWCPQFGANQPRQNPPKPSPFRWGSSPAAPTPEESETHLANLLKVCKNTCRLASPACFSRNGGGVGDGNAEQRGLHVLRASLRDQEGKRYVFVLQETEGWKVAIGLQRLRRGTQVRALGVAGMPMNDCKSVLGGLGYV